MLKNLSTRLNIKGLHADLWSVAVPTGIRVLLLRWATVSKHMDQAKFCQNNRSVLVLFFRPPPLTR